MSYATSTHCGFFRALRALYTYLFSVHNTMEIVHLLFSRTHSHPITNLVLSDFAAIHYALLSGLDLPQTSVTRGLCCITLRAGFTANVTGVYIGPIKVPLQSQQNLLTEGWHRPRSSKQDLTSKVCEGLQKYFLPRNLQGIWHRTQ